MPAIAILVASCEVSSTVTRELSDSTTAFVPDVWASTSLSVFLTCDTQFVNAQDWETFLPTLPALMDNSANLFDLGFEPLRERV